MSEVSEILGKPDSEHHSVTGKAWIPYYFGDDVTRLTWYYKGLGRVNFTGGGAFGQGGGEVQSVEYDPSQGGYRR